MNLNLIDDNELAVMGGKVLKHLMAALHLACLVSWYLILSIYMQYELKVLSFYGDMELNDWSTMFYSWPISPNLNTLVKDIWTGKRFNLQ